MRDDEPVELLTVPELLSPVLLRSVRTEPLVADLFTERVVVPTLVPVVRRAVVVALLSVIDVLLLPFADAETSRPFTLLATLEPVVVLLP